MVLASERARACGAEEPRCSVRRPLVPTRSNNRAASDPLNVLVFGATVSLSSLRRCSRRVRSRSWPRPSRGSLVLAGASGGSADSSGPLKSKILSESSQMWAGRFCEELSPRSLHGQGPSRPLGPLQDDRRSTSDQTPGLCLCSRQMSSERRTREAALSPFEDAGTAFRVMITQRRAVCLTSPSV